MSTTLSSGAFALYFRFLLRLDGGGQAGHVGDGDCGGREADGEVSSGPADVSRNAVKSTAQKSGAYLFLRGLLVRPRM